MTRYGSVELASQYTAQVWWIIWQPACDMFCMLVLLHLCMFVPYQDQISRYTHLM